MQTCLLQMDSKRRYPWMRHAAAEDNELENKSDVWKVTTHTHTHTHLKFGLGQKKNTAPKRASAKTKPRAGNGNR